MRRSSAARRCHSWCGQPASPETPGDPGNTGTPGRAEKQISSGFYFNELVRSAWRQPEGMHAGCHLEI